MFWVIHLTETDGNIILWACLTMEDVEAYVKQTNLHALDYSIIEGVRIKDFNNTFNN
jgi:hypothetical protein